MRNVSQPQDRNGGSDGVKSQPIVVVPEPPRNLTEKAADYWREIAPKLVELNILTDLHLTSFMILCQVYGEYLSLQEWLDIDPEQRCWFETDKGYRCESPQLRQRDKMLATLQKLWPKFGLQPLSLAVMRKHGGVATPVVVDDIGEFSQRKYGPHETQQRKTKRSNKQG